MNNEKFKDAKRTNFVVGDRVRIIDARSIESYELNKIGTIVEINIRNDGEWGTHVVDMGRPRRPSCLEDNETRWWLNKRVLELVNQPGEQLLFDFYK